MPGSETNFGAASWRRGGSRRGGTKRRREARTRLSAGARPVRDRCSAWPRKFERGQLLRIRGQA